MSNIEGASLIDLPQITDGRGNLSFVEAPGHVPFAIRRIYYLYDVPGGQARGEHAHKDLQQLIIAIHGSFEVALDDGRGGKERHRLSRPDSGLLLETLTWREITDFSPGAVCLVLASEHYDEADYIRDYDEFVAVVKARSSAG